MKSVLSSLTLASAALWLLASPTPSQAQNQDRPGRGNFDPEEMRQRMMENYREQMAVKNDDEWKVIEPRIAKVMEARREVGFGGFGFRGPGGPGGRGPGGPAGRGPGGAQDDANAPRGNRGPGGPGGFRPGGAANEQIDALRQAVDSNASADDIKAKLADVRKVRKESEAKLSKAQEDLRAVLNVRQEAVAVLGGLLE